MQVVSMSSGRQIKRWAGWVVGGSSGGQVRW